VTEGSTPAATLPVIAVLCRVPLVAEALMGAFEGMAEVRSLPTHSGDTAGVLRWLRPDAVIVDDERAAESAAPYVATEGGLLVHVSIADGTVRVFQDESWEVVDVDGSTPDAIRNLVIGSLLRRVDA
jgi:hypothetical protein